MGPDVTGTFYIYIDGLAGKAEANESAKNGTGATVMVADDASLLQAKTHCALQSLTDVATKWKVERENNWSIAKCNFLQAETGRGK